MRAGERKMRNGKLLSPILTPPYRLAWGGMVGVGGQHPVGGLAKTARVAVEQCTLALQPLLHLRLRAAVALDFGIDRFRRRPTLNLANAHKVFRIECLQQFGAAGTQRSA